MSMTPRERWLACLKGERPDRVPTDYRGTSEINAKLVAHFGVSSLRDVLDRLEVDDPVNVSPRYVGPPLEKGEKVWGYKSTPQDYGSGVYDEVTYYPLADAQSVADLERHRWPSPDWWDFSEIQAQCDAAPERLLTGGTMEARLTYAYLRGLETSLLDLVERPEMAESILDRIFDYHREMLTRLLEAAGGRIHLTGVHDDFGAQESLLISPAAFRRFFKERMRRQIALAKEAGLYVMHHDDGAIRAILPDLIEIGIDVLDPIQWRCKGMEREGLARDFGKDLVFHGGVDNQHTLAFGSPKDVRNEVAENLRIFAGARGHIVSPCHNIQSISPVENVLAMYEAAREFGSPPPVPSSSAEA